MNRLKSSLALTVVLVLVTDGIAMSQSDSGTAVNVIPHAWSVQFSVQNVFNLGSLDGAQFSFRRQYSAHRSIRVAVTLDAGLTKSDYSQDITSNDSSYFFADSYDLTRRWNALLSLKYFWHKEVTRRLHSQFGMGPQFGYGFSRFERNYPNGDRSIQISRSLNMGVAGSLGAEYYFIRGISLFAEVNIAVAWVRTSNRLQRRQVTSTGREVSNQKTINSTLQVTNETGRLGLSISL